MDTSLWPYLLAHTVEHIVFTLFEVKIGNKEKV